ncbi:metallophosphoesterase [Chryseomicrobium sp. FSL W7-1435]|uniref:metallophosphoesterase n=1 Tax=Chryseomicrobium sp. FSL W7-1435 TaxID=2921704 RepID=UPI00315A0C1C
MKKLLTISALLTLLAAATYYGNTTIASTSQTIQLQGLPPELEGLTISHVSDLHDAEFGEGQEELIKTVKEQQPDLIFLTGDIIDSNRYDLEKSLKAVSGFVEIAPVYYVTGNHEIATGQESEIKSRLSQLGVQALSNELVTVAIEGQSIELLGIEDPLTGASVADVLALHRRSELPRLTLSHRPEVFEDYVSAGEQLVFSGHAHGGQFRIPGIGGLIAPGQGLFPTYTAGIHEKEATQMIVSRGLGNSLFPFRLFNRPEVIKVTITP